jgi:DNA (cytosine-5)-methyltransferase 1
MASRGRPKWDRHAYETVGLSLVAHALRGEGFDASEDGTGRGTPLVPEVAGTRDRLC